MAGGAAIRRASASPVIGYTLTCYSRETVKSSPLQSSAVEFVGYPDQRAVADSAVVAGQVNDAGIDDETAELDEVPRALAAFDLPCPRVMPRYRVIIFARSPSGSRSPKARSTS